MIFNFPRKTKFKINCIFRWIIKTAGRHNRYLIFSVKLRTEYQKLFHHIKCCVATIIHRHISFSASYHEKNICANKKERCLRPQLIHISTLKQHSGIPFFSFDTQVDNLSIFNVKIKQFEKPLKPLILLCFSAFIKSQKIKLATGIEPVMKSPNPL